MDESHLHFSTIGAERLLISIRQRFPTFYQQRTGLTFSELKSSHMYWANQVGDFLRGLSKEPVNSTKDGNPDTSNTKKRLYDKSYLLKDEIILTDASVLYEDLYLFTKYPKKSEVVIPYSTIEGLFTIFFDDEINKNPLSFGTWHSLSNGIMSLDEGFSFYKNELIKHSWSLFSFWESLDESDRHSDYSSSTVISTKQRGIRQSIVNFGNDDSIRIGNISDTGQVNYYEGTYHFRKESEYLYLETKPLKIHSERYFRLMLYFGEERIDQIALGVYYNVRRLGSLLCGSALLVKNPTEQKEKIESAGCILYSRWDSVPNEFETIRQYLERRSQNYIKLPSKLDLFKLSELKQTLDVLREKESQWDFRLNKYDYFLSVPLTYTNSEAFYNRNSAIAKKLIELLNTTHPNNTHSCACEEAQTFEDYKTMSDDESYKKALTAIEQSKNFIWLYPKTIIEQGLINTGINENNHVHYISSAIIELGYAMGLKKPIIVFYDWDEVVHLPKNLRDYKPQTKIAFDASSEDGLERSFLRNIERIKTGMKSM